jgi:hypothetical protein
MTPIPRVPSSSVRATNQTAADVPRKVEAPLPTHPPMPPRCTRFDKALNHPTAPERPHLVVVGPTCAVSLRAGRKASARTAVVLRRHAGQPDHGLVVQGPAKGGRVDADLVPPVAFDDEAVHDADREEPGAVPWSG